MTERTAGTAPFTDRRVDECIADWLSTYRSQGTREAYARSVRNYRRWLAGRGLNFTAVKRSDADLFREWLEQPIHKIHGKDRQRYAYGSVRHHLDSAGSLYSYLVAEEVLARNPFYKVRRPPASMESLTVGLSAAEAVALLKFSGNGDRMEHALLWVMLATGLRVTEICSLDLVDVTDDHRGMIFHTKVKGDRPSQMAPPGPAADAVREWLVTRPSSTASKALFLRGGIRLTRDRVTTILARLCRDAGVPVISPHGARHTCATLMLDTGATLSDVQLQLGHRSLETTLRYDRARRIRLNTASNALTDLLSGKAPH